jgi:hypothetical protein
MAAINSTNNFVYSESVHHLECPLKRMLEYESTKYILAHFQE